MDLFGFEVAVRFRLSGREVLAYGWHWDSDRAARHLEALVRFHRIPGRSVADPGLETWLGEQLTAVVQGGAVFSLPDFPYRERPVWDALLRIPRGATRTYGSLAKEAGLPYPRLLAALLKNPFQVLLPCHRLVTQKGTPMGFYPLGATVKRRLLELEGVRLEE